VLGWHDHDGGTNVTDHDHDHEDAGDGPEVAIETEPNPHHEPLPDLGHFSVSLAVADLAASRDFYERLGMEVMGGDGSTYLMLRNPRGGATIGLFQGLFEGNVLTFNPGLDPAGEHTETFDDVRDLEARWRELGLEPVDGADPSSDGPAHVTLKDPDGNAILVDQFWPRPS
jgi:catechol 2,3-dioxygenase-like lactoylglutathione lyase family enzyme